MGIVFVMGIVTERVGIEIASGMAGMIAKAFKDIAGKAMMVIRAGMADTIGILKMQLLEIWIRIVHLLELRSIEIIRIVSVWVTSMKTVMSGK